ncbi:hypothetical protein D3C73_1290410 [compost metagenome]
MEPCGLGFVQRVGTQRPGNSLARVVGPHHVPGVGNVASAARLVGVELPCSQDLACGLVHRHEGLAGSVLDPFGPGCCFAGIAVPGKGLALTDHGLQDGPDACPVVRRCFADLEGLFLAHSRHASSLVHIAEFAGMGTRGQE